MNFSFFIARRLSLSANGYKSSPAIKVSITAVALSVAVMIAAIAIVIGFKREIREKVIGFNSHLTVYTVPVSQDDDNLMTLTPSLRKVLDATPFITDYSLDASIPAVFKTKSDFKGVYLRTLSSQATREFLADNMEKGVLPDFSKGENDEKVVISDIASRQLGLEPGNKIDTYFISDQVKVRRLEIAGVYNSHFDSYDDVIAYGSLSMVQKLVDIFPDQGTLLQARVSNFDSIDDYTSKLNSILADATADGRLYKQYRVDNARTLGAGYFNWLSMLDTNVVVILALMAIVAVATLISGMLILVLDKKRFIGVARAMGASISNIRNVFIYLALKVALIGIIIGNVVMIAFLWCQDKWHFLHLDPDAYYIDFVPVELDLWWILLLNASCFLVIWLCLLLPSRFVAGISPAEAMRIED